MFEVILGAFGGFAILRSLACISKIIGRRVKRTKQLGPGRKAHFSSAQVILTVIIMSVQGHSEQRLCCVWDFFFANYASRKRLVVERNGEHDTFDRQAFKIILWPFIHF